MTKPHDRFRPCSFAHRCGPAATWNYWAKRAGGGLPFVYLVSLMINAGYLPVVGIYWVLRRPSFSPAVILVIVGSGILKTGYSLYLQRGYRVGDFSLVYPVARGTGPLLSTIAAIFLLGERPPLRALLGGLLIIASLFWITGGTAVINRLFRHSPSGEDRVNSSSLKYGLVSGFFIAAYTLWDRRGVSDWLIPPILYDAGTALTQLVLLTPFAWRRRSEVASEWRKHRANALIVAAISPVAYLLVLTALRFTPVSYVAPAREVSIVIGAFFGAKYLGEAQAKRRLWASGVMVIGVVTLSLS